MKFLLVRRAITALLVPSLVPFAAAVAAPAAAEATLAARSGALPQAVVRYAESDLASEEGARRVYERLTRAAATLCPPVTRDPQRNVVAKQCVREVLDDAVGRIAAPRLTHVHEGRRPARVTRLAGG